jgi:hypothetical protein
MSEAATTATVPEAPPDPSGTADCFPDCPAPSGCWGRRLDGIGGCPRVGGVYPQHCAGTLGERFRVRTQVLLRGTPAAKVTVHLRFLQIVERRLYRVGPRGPVPVEVLHLADEEHRTAQEAVERRWICPPWSPRRGPRTSTVDLAAGADREPLRAESGSVAGTLVRARQRLTGRIRLDSEPVSDAVLRVTVDFENTSPCPPPGSGSGDVRRASAPYAFISTHAVLHTDTGEFVSPSDPPPELREATESCAHTGLRPALTDREQREGRQRDQGPYAAEVLAAPVAR